MLIVAALGRSALARGRRRLRLEARISAIAQSLAALVPAHRLVIAHEAGAGDAGHLLARELRNALPDSMVDCMLVEAVVTDAAGLGAGESVASPCRIVELELLRRMVERDGDIVCVGCIPVRIDAAGKLGSSEAILDHDQVAATLAIELGADILLLLTDVAAVYADWPAKKVRITRIDCKTPPIALEARSIGRKLAAACRFAATPGSFAVIGAADAAEALVAGSAGTCISTSR